EARPGPRRGIMRDLPRRAARVRVCAAAHQEGGGRQRQRREDSGAAHGQDDSRLARGPAGRRGGRPRCGHLPCTFARRACRAGESGGRVMIGFLRGTLVSKRPPSLTLEVGGVGYDVDAPMSTFYKLPDLGQPLMLVTHFAVREDAHVLYGFSSENERAL